MKYWFGGREGIPAFLIERLSLDTYLVFFERKSGDKRNGYEPFPYGVIFGFSFLSGAFSTA